MQYDTTVTDFAKALRTYVNAAMADPNRGPEWLVGWLEAVAVSDATYLTFAGRSDVVTELTKTLNERM